MSTWFTTKRKAVSIVEAKFWNRTFSKLALINGNGETIDYEGEYLESSTISPSILTVSVSSSVFRPSTLEVPIFADSSLEMRLLDERAPDKTTASSTAACKSRALKIVKFETTELTTPSAVAQLRIAFVPGRQSEPTFLLLSDDQSRRGLALVQPFDFNYFLSAVAFYFTSWLLIASVAIIIAILSHGLSANSYIAYAAACSVLALFLSWLEIPGLDKLPVSQYLRSTFVIVRKGHWAIRVALVGLSVFACSYAIFIGNGALRRFQYSGLVIDQLQEVGDSRQIHDQALRQAFAQMPWRKEAPAIFEAIARKARAQGDAPFRQYVRSFTSDPNINAAIHQAMASELPYYLRIEGGRTSIDNVYVIDPVTWFASLMIDGEDRNGTTETRKALDLLNSYIRPGDGEAILYKTWIEVSLANDSSSMTELTLRLRQEFNQFGAELRQREIYQIVVDTLACDAIVNGKQSEAIHLFRMELEARKGTTRIPWLRPPEKLMLYWMFYALAIENRMAADIRPSWQIERAEQFFHAPHFKERLKREVFELEEFKEFQNPDYWTEGTFSFENQQHDSATRKVISEEMLPHGWRY